MKANVPKFLKEYSVSLAINASIPIIVLLWLLGDPWDLWEYIAICIAFWTFSGFLYYLGRGQKKDADEASTHDRPSKKAVYKGV